MKLIYKVLAPLASLTLQERYIVNGYRDNYLLPEELLNSAINFFFEQRGVPYENTASLDEFKKSIQNCDIPETISRHELVHKYTPWIRVREKARVCLNELGFDLEKWEKNEL
jgi:hypothetical protein